MSVFVGDIPDHEGGPWIKFKVIEIDPKLLCFFIADSSSFSLGIIGLLIVGVIELIHGWIVRLCFLLKF